ncbi:hypothetical protein K5I29_04715 [Flavobacterium agricola]|uniref:Lipoprotein n=1 Tax=Flavobacterium agricola TaxID=2870839 RepID=A0ABY6M0W3_9FLAO|nr:hypothetical protein [Flavobacterium agricola]UYW02209.1 hypothetical protein K5I29_04715 [Flavobacterium agricola]
MNKFYTFIFLAFISISCTNKSVTTDLKETDSMQETNHSIIGNDKDDHGCIGSAGQTWSQLQNSCVQVFTIGIRLDPVIETADTAVSSAFIVFNSDKSQAEIFLPDADVSVILPNKDGATYSNTEYAYDSDSGVLYQSNTEIYKQ